MDPLKIHTHTQIIVQSLASYANPILITTYH